MVHLLRSVGETLFPEWTGETLSLQIQRILMTFFFCVEEAEEVTRARPMIVLSQMEGQAAMQNRPLESSVLGFPGMGRRQFIFMRLGGLGPSGTLQPALPQFF